MKVIVIVSFCLSLLATESKCLCSAMTTDKTKCPCFQQTQLGQGDNFWLGIFKESYGDVTNELKKVNSVPHHYLFTDNEIKCRFNKYLLQFVNDVTGWSTMISWGCGEQPSNSVCSIPSGLIEDVVSAYYLLDELDCNTDYDNAVIGPQSILKAMAANTF